MASKIYQSAAYDEAVGNINFGSDTFYAMLVTSSYAADMNAHSKRSSITNEVSGTGYTAGGKAIAATVARDDGNERVTITFAATTWPAASITARGMVVYKHRGGAASADELIFYNDFGSDIISTAGDFAVTAAVLRKNNLT